MLGCSGWLASLVCGLPSNIFSKPGFVATYCLNLFLSWNVLFSPLMVNACFAGSNSLVS